MSFLEPKRIAVEARGLYPTPTAPGTPYERTRAQLTRRKGEPLLSEADQRAGHCVQCGCPNEDIAAAGACASCGSDNQLGRKVQRGHWR